MVSKLVVLDIFQMVLEVKRVVAIEFLNMIRDVGVVEVPTVPR